MKKNMGKIDKGLRILVAIVFAVLNFMGIVTGTVGIILLVLSVIFLLTSLVSFCPLYLPIGLNTSKKD